MNQRSLPGPPAGKTGWPWTISNDTDMVNAPYQLKQWPKISVVTPSLNQGDYIEKTIRSVLMQQYPNLEYIIIDGGSTDQTVDTISKYNDWITFWVSEKDNGQSDAINKGFGRSTGQIYAWLNSDDYYLPGAFHKIAEHFAQTPGASVVVGTGHKVMEDGRIVYTPKIPDLSYDAILNWSYSHFMQPSCFFSAESWKNCGPLREDLYYCLDVDLWLKMARKYTFHRMHHSLSHALIHPGAKTTAKRERMKVETALMVCQHGAFNIARESLMKFADEHYNLKIELRKFRNTIFRKAAHYIRRIRI